MNKLEALLSLFVSLASIVFSLALAAEIRCRVGQIEIGLSQRQRVLVSLRIFAHLEGLLEITDGQRHVSHDVRVLGQVVVDDIHVTALANDQVSLLNKTELFEVVFAPD